MKVVKIIIILLLTVISVGFAAAVYFVYDISKPLPNLKEMIIFTIKEGDGVNQVAANLKEKEILEKTFNFETLLWVKKQENKLQAGEYELIPGISVNDLANKFTAGIIAPKEIWVTIPEGFNSKDIEKRLIEKGLVKEGQFTNKIKNYRYDFSGQTDNGEPLSSLEGYLFPDTYKFYKDSTIEEIINKMLNNFDRKITSDLREEIKERGKTLREIVIMASIVEKEVHDTEEMKKVASVFYNRLSIDMALESDATVNFATGKSRRQATLEDIKSDSSYNTYRFKGLPPGPISNPGINAIKAAIYPEKTDYLYFLSPESGPTIFSKTFEEHKQAKIKYLNNN